MDLPEIKAGCRKCLGTGRKPMSDERCEECGGTGSVQRVLRPRETAYWQELLQRYQWAQELADSGAERIAEYRHALEEVEVSLAVLDGAELDAEARRAVRAAQFAVDRAMYGVSVPNEAT